MTQQVLADLLGVTSRTVGNWENDKGSPRSRLGALEKVLQAPLGPAADPVEQAVRGSELVEWRQDAVLSVYKRNIHEQRVEEAS